MRCKQCGSTELLVLANEEEGVKVRHCNQTWIIDYKVKHLGDGTTSGKAACGSSLADSAKEGPFRLCSGCFASAKVYKGAE